MTEPSQYFKGRTVQEQMDEVIGYVDKRAEEVAAAKAGAVLQPAEEAKTAAQAAAEAAESAKNATIAALPEIRQDITELKAEDTALDGRLDTVELKVTTAEGNIVTIQGQIVALQTADGKDVKLTGDQTIDGVKTFTSSPVVPTATTGTADTKAANGTKVKNELDNYAPMMRLNDNQDIRGTKRNLGILLDRVTYIKNTLGSEGFVPVFRIPNNIIEGNYLKAVFLISGRTIPTSITEIVWNGTNITHTDIVGTQTALPAIYSDTDGKYWLCMKISNNNAISMLEFLSLRNAGFDERLIPIYEGTTPDMSGWTLVIS